MNLALQLRIMLLALRAGGTRAIFASGAVAVGIAALMMMLALGAGARRELEAVAEKMGKNLFMINAGRVAVAPGRGDGWTISTRMKLSDAVALRQRVPAIRSVAPLLEGSRQTNLNGNEHVTSVRGVTPEFVELRNFALADGRLLDAEDGRSRSRVAVVGPFVSDRLNEGQSLVGETILVAGVPFLVVGELEEKGITDGQNEDDQVLIPLETARRRLFNVESLSRLLVQAVSAEAMPRVQRAARDVLRESHELDGASADDFEILSLIRANQMRKVSSEFVQSLAKLFAALTLAIGGAGVLAVTWLNAKDRIAEIGLRIALGARSRDIALLFVAEASALSVAGGFAGLAIGAVAIVVLKTAIGWEMAVDLRSVAVPLLIAVVLGPASGLAPALRAARVPPVEALRDR